MALIAIAIGWTQGFLRPVFAELSFALAVVLMALVHGPLLDLVLPHLDVPPYLVVVIATILLAFLINVPASRLAGRVRATRLGRVDRLLGIGLQLLSALVVVSLLLITSQHADRAVRPLLASGPRRPITAAQIDAFAAGVKRDAVLSTLARPDQLAADRAFSGTGRLTLDLLEQQHPWLRAYLGVRPAILSSQLAPLVLRYGGRLPWLAG
ncbi:MAG: CvpA family protein [Candidatus Dormibacteraeota bacterium]|nr:CvpA family protein [Candidatus Dormibacteraeota bacterium]